MLGLLLRRLLWLLLRRLLQRLLLVRLAQLLRRCLLQLSQYRCGGGLRVRVWLLLPRVGGLGRRRLALLLRLPLPPSMTALFGDRRLPRCCR